MSTVHLWSDARAEASPRVKAVFDDIRATRKSDFVNNFWRALANDPASLERIWAGLKAIMVAPGALDPLVKEMIYIAVSAANGCTYCAHSHTAAARAKGRACEAIERLEGDHDRAAPLHARGDSLLDEWVRGGSLPLERSTELGALLEALRELYRAHIHVEDTEIFPLAGTLLSAEELAAVGSEMRARRGISTPE